jgi:ribokinase
MKILVFGSLNIDMVFSVEHIVKPGETIGSGALVRSAGGKGANQAAALAKAGMPVFMAGKIGQDGRFLLDLLNSYGVDTGKVAVDEGATGQAIIQLDKNRQNAIVLYPGGNARVTEEEIQKTLPEFGGGDILLLQNEIVFNDLIMRGAKERGMKIYMNPSPYGKEIEKLPLELADAFFVNEIEGAALSGLAPESPLPLILEKLAERFPAAEIILTAGREGAFYAFRRDRAKGDIVELPVADTTGAGDTFSGYFIAARVKGFPPAAALQIACKAASYAVSRRGAMEAIPLAREIF